MEVKMVAKYLVHAYFEKTDLRKAYSPHLFRWHYREQNHHQDPVHQAIVCLGDYAPQGSCASHRMLHLIVGH